MGFGGISIWQLLIILAIVVMIFGTKRLRNIGSDLGGAIKGFRKSMQNDEDDSAIEKKDDDGTVIDAKAEEVNENAENKTNS